MIFLVALIFLPWIHLLGKRVQVGLLCMNDRVIWGLWQISTETVGRSHSLTVQDSLTLEEPPGWEWREQLCYGHSHQPFAPCNLLIPNPVPYLAQRTLCTVHHKVAWHNGKQHVWKSCFARFLLGKVRMVESSFLYRVLQMSRKMRPVQISGWHCISHSCLGRTWNIHRMPTSISHTWWEASRARRLERTDSLWLSLSSDISQQSFYCFSITLQVANVNL